MNQTYNVNLPIEVLFDQIEDGMDYTDAGNHPKTPAQKVMISQPIVQEIGIFADNLKVWKRLPDLDRAWTRFKTDFTLAHQELRENADVGQGALNQANISRQQPEIVKAVANLTEATAVDRNALAALTATVNSLTLQPAATNKLLTAVNAQLETANDTIASLAKNAQRGTNRGRWRGRGQKNADTRDPKFVARIGGPTACFYCWSCGVFCYHSSARCCNRKAGHKDEATAENEMNESTHSFA